MSPKNRLTQTQDTLKRRVQNAFPSLEDVTERLAGQEKLTIYLGIDPTGTELHLGHTIPMLLLADLAELGHDTVLLIGDFTARIGDPTDKSAARQALTADQVEENMATYLDQAYKIIPKDSFRVAYNSEWLSSMNMEQVLSLTARVTVQQMLARDMFQERLKKEQPIHVSEFLYPLMQGYDSVALRTDGEVGGNDQTFNMLVGRELEKEILGKDKIVLATRLLVDVVSGKKMSKSEGTLIAIDDSPQEIRRKVLALDDKMTKTIFELCTRKDAAWIDEQAAGDPRQFKEALAAELVRMYHGEGAVSEANEPSPSPADTAGSLAHALKVSGAASSTTTAKALISQGAVSVNGKTATRWDVEVNSEDIIKVGKGKLVKVK